MSKTVNVLIAGASNTEIAEQLCRLYAVESEDVGNEIVIMLSEGAWLSVVGDGWDPMADDSPDAMYEWDILVCGGGWMPVEDLARKVFDDLIAVTPWAIGLFPVDHVTEARPMMDR